MTGHFGRGPSVVVLVVLLAVAGCGTGTEQSPDPPAGGSPDPDGDVLLLGGIIDLVAETATIGPARRLPARQPAEPDPPGPFRLVLEDEHGDEVAAVDFTPGSPSPESETGELVLVSHFDLRIPTPLPPLTRATISYRDQPLGSREAGAAAPTVRIVALTAGEDVAYHDATFAWEGRDDDGDDLVYSVLLSTDGGDTWRSLAAGTARTDLTVPASSHALQRSDEAHLLVSVSDGLNST